MILKVAVRLGLLLLTCTKKGKCIAGLSVVGLYKTRFKAGFSVVGF